MDLIILAAGIGSRLKGKYKVPKSMIPLADGSTSLLSILNTLGESSESIVLVTGPQKEYFYEHLSDYKIQYVQNDYYLEYSNAYSLYLGLKSLLSTKRSSGVLIIDADTYISQEAAIEILEEVNSNPKNSTLFTTLNKRSVGEWGISSDKNSFITSIVELKDDSIILPITSGISYFCLPQPCFSLLEDYQELGYWDDIYKEHFKDMNLKSYGISGLLSEIDYEEDIVRLNTLLSK